MATQAPVVVVYGPSLHLHCLCEITGRSQSSLKGAKHGGGGREPGRRPQPRGCLTPSAGQTSVLGFLNFHNPLLFPLPTPHYPTSLTPTPSSQSPAPSSLVFQIDPPPFPDSVQPPRASPSRLIQPRLCPTIWKSLSRSASYLLQHFSPRTTGLTQTESL